MSAALLCERLVAPSAIGVHAAARLHRILHERNQTRCRGVPYPAHTHVPHPDVFLLHGYCNQSLALGLPSGKTLIRTAPEVSSTCTTPLSRSRPERTIARRSLCSQVEAVR